MSIMMVSASTALVTSAFQVGPAAPGLRVATPAVELRMAADSTYDRRSVLQQGCVAGGAATLGALGSPLSASASDKDWEVVNLPIISETAPILFDIEFDDKNPNQGWIVGNRGTFLQTADAGRTWEAKSFANLDPDEEINYRFTKVSFKDGEGWIIGKPAILLHTKDAGASWERVPLSPKLPGDPYGIVALGPGKAEMSTSGGAIYITENAGRNWKAQVRETIDATLNRVSSSGVQGASYFSGSINSIQRDADGSYLAVSSRGNFYLTYKPGDEFCAPPAAPCRSEATLFERARGQPPAAREFCRGATWRVLPWRHVASSAVAPRGAVRPPSPLYSAQHACPRRMPTRGRLVCRVRPRDPSQP